MGRGGSESTSGGTIAPAKEVASVISFRPGQDAYDQDDLIYFSGGHMPARGFRFLNSGAAYISVHARPDGSFEVLRQARCARGRFVGLGSLQLELLHASRDLMAATVTAFSARKELEEAGLQWDGNSNPALPSLEALEEALAQLAEIRRRSGEGRGPAIVEGSFVEKLKAEGSPGHLIETAERARDTNPTAVGRQTLPPRRIR